MLTVPFHLTEQKVETHLLLSNRRYYLSAIEASLSKLGTEDQAHCLPRL
jgi:hypothetical protein